MPEQYTLTYFAIKGVAEPIRLMLCYGKINFIDKRVPRKDWPKLKESMPMGQMPTLEIDGKVLHQSMAICRYLAKQFGIAGSNKDEELEIEMMAETINDFRQIVARAHYESNAQARSEKFTTLKAETLPFYLKKLDDFVAKGNGYFALGKLTWADIFFVAYEDYVSMMSLTDITEKYPNLKALKEKVLAIPQIADWYKKDHLYE